MCSIQNIPTIICLISIYSYLFLFTVLVEIIFVKYLVSLVLPKHTATLCCWLPSLIYVCICHLKQKTWVLPLPKYYIVGWYLINLRFNTVWGDVSCWWFVSLSVVIQWTVMLWHFVVWGSWLLEHYMNNVQLTILA